MKCDFIKLDGKQCHANSLLNDKRCWLHSNIITEEQRFLARSKGGKMKNIKCDIHFSEFRLQTVKDVMQCNAIMINKVLSDELDLRIATGITYMLNLQIKGIEIAEIEKRLSLLEDKISKTDYELSE